MSRVLTVDERSPGGEATLTGRTTLGFWIYIMTDCVLFACLFATFAVLRGNVNGGPNGQELFSMPYVLVETLALLTSSFTCGLGLLAGQRGATRQVLGWFAVTALLGLLFLGMELHEFRNLALEGNSWNRSGFLSAFFTLVGTHGAHITSGLIWLGALMARIAKRGITPVTARRMTMFGMFWHFLDVVWIFIFTVVYLLGVAKP